MYVIALDLSQAKVTKANNLYTINKNSLTTVFIFI